MRLCVLGSGSSGNCTYVSSGGTALLVDAGLSGRETFKRIADCGLDASLVKSILLTHEHSDHVGALSVLHKRLKADVFANSGTIQGVQKGAGQLSVPWKVFTTGFSFQVGEIAVEPFTVCHDGLDPVGFVFSHQGARVGVVTDIGVVTSVVREKLRNCNAIVLESNHDEAMLRAAQRPWALKQRIAGRQGHLANRHAADLVVECAGPSLKHVFLAHLSSDCNRPDLAVRTMVDALRKRSLEGVAVSLTFPDKPGDVWSM
ncbi:MAG: MBL fold metallo-hydrolase [bacterium]